MEPESLLEAAGVSAALVLSVVEVPGHVSSVPVKGGHLLMVAQ